jgi:hypothetical protein
MNCSHWLRVACLLALCLGLSKPARATSVAGMNYWPAGYSCTVLQNANWSAQKSVVAADLDQMASFRVGVIRIMFWPEASGFLISSSGPSYTSAFYEQKANLPEFIGMCQSRGIKVIISFGNSYQSGGDGTSSTNRWWMNAYGNTVAGYTNFLNDTKLWLNGFVDAVLASPYGANVLYFDYQNEYNHANPYEAWYVTFLYDWSNVPAGKRGVSVLQMNSDADDLQYQLGTRHIDFVEFHSYPAISFNSNIENCYDHMVALFPTTTVLLGEYGRQCPTTAEETAQKNTVVDLATRSINKGIPYFLNWMLWDGAISSATDHTTAWGFSADSPKDALGAMTEKLNLVYNSDAETISGGVPSGWGGAGSGNTNFMAMGPSTIDAASNSYYARLQALDVNEMVWMTLPYIDVAGGERIYADFYFRSSMQNVRVAINEFDANWNLTRQQYGPGYSPTTWSYKNYLHTVGSWSLVLQSSTRHVIVGINADGRATWSPNSAYLDVDCASVAVRSPT